jgi:DNA-binding NtrC family response regulator
MPEKVLLVDDEKEFLEAMAERMTVRGIEVSTASSASEAIRLAEKESFDAIIVDLMMPEMDGLEALKLLKKKSPESEVILLTGHATLEKGIEAMKLGAVDFLEKPANITELTEKIKEAHAHKMIVVEKQIEERIRNIMNVKGW